MKKVITRFAPSPTGKMHIGNARTALFNYMYARHTGGEFLLRIEDTDKERSTDENTNLIYEALNRMGLSWDGNVVIQSDNLDRHTEVANLLIEKGFAYRAYDTREELDAMRAEAEKNKTSFKYKSVWQDVNHPPYPDDKPYVVRIRNTFEDNHPIVVNDMVQGEVTRLAKEVDDFIILRSDGTPTYLLSVVVDDHDAGVNTIIRGDDHLTNTFRQYLIWHGMGWDVPEYGHVPLIHGPDGKKLSKRNGSVSIEDLDNDGFGLENMPGIINYLTTLGWTPKPDKISSAILTLGYDDIISYLKDLGWDFPNETPDYNKIVSIFENSEINDGYAYDMGNVIFETNEYFESIGGKYKIPEIYSLDDMIRKFDIHDVNKSPAQFDIKKLTYMNGIWMGKVSLEEFTESFYEYLKREQPDFLEAVSSDKIDDIIHSLPVRSKTFKEAYDMIKYLDPVLYNENIKDKDLTKDIEMCKDIISSQKVNENTDIMEAMKAYAEEKGLKLKVVATSVRNVFTGQKISPPLHDIINKKTFSDLLKKAGIKPNLEPEI